MATEVVHSTSSQPISSRPKISWGAVFGGTFVALGVWILLYSLGLALGLSAIDPNDPGSARAAGIGTGIWGLIAPLIALFVGGLVAARTAGVLDRVAGVLHGAVLWGLTTVVGLLVFGMALSTLVSGAVRLGSQAVGAVGSAATQAAPALREAVGIDFDDVLAPVNQRLAAQGKPAIRADQLKAATQDVVDDALRTGQLNRETLVSSIAQNTQLDRADAEDLANRVSAALQQQQAKLGGVAQDIQQGALQAADTTGKAFWGVFGALFLSLVSAILGATVGAGRKQKESGVPPPPLETRREVYP